MPARLLDQQHPRAPGPDRFLRVRSQPGSLEGCCRVDARPGRCLAALRSKGTAQTVRPGRRG
eukprot:2734936-Pleurochrysis_carterae.AAC.1